MWGGFVMYGVLGITICVLAIASFVLEWRRRGVRTGGGSTPGKLASAIRGVGGLGFGVGIVLMPSALTRWLVGIGVVCLVFSAMFDLFVVRRSPMS